MRSKCDVNAWKSLSVAIALLSSAVVLAGGSASAADAPTYTGITIDGLAQDWDGVPSQTVTLMRPLATSQKIVNGLEWKVAHDDANIYFLFLVEDDYDYNATDHDFSAAIAVLFPIDAAATPDMGGGNGNVDIWHWELDCAPGVLSGYYLLSGNDPDCNLDDEWSLSSSDRHDDGGANEVYGAWSHTDMSAPGATGQWIFEMKRSLTTADTENQDAQFAVGEPIKMSFAYWDPDENATGWTPAGHYATCKDTATFDFSWLEINLEPAPDIDAMEAQIAAQQAVIDDQEVEIENLTLMNGALQNKVSTLETDTAALETGLTAAQTSSTAATAAAAAAQVDATKARNDMGSATTTTYLALLLAIVGLALGAMAMVRKPKGPAPEAKAE